MFEAPGCVIWEIIRIGFIIIGFFLALYLQTAVQVLFSVCSSRVVDKVNHLGDTTMTFLANALLKCRLSMKVHASERWILIYGT